MTILSGYVATPVPGPLTVDTPVPGPVVVATGIPGPTVVPTPVPFWLREIFGYLAAEGEITVQVGGIRMGSTEAIVRGNGRVAAAVSSVWLSAPEQLLTGLGRLEVLARFGANAGTKLLEGVGSVVLSSFAPKLPAGVRTLAGRGAVTASGILYRLRPAGVTLAGRGGITASVTTEKLNAGTRTLAAGRGAFVVASISQKLSAPAFLAAAQSSVTNGKASTSITTSEPATIVVAQMCWTSSPVLTVDSTAATQIARVGDWSLWAITVGAGSHLIESGASGWNILAASAYTQATVSTSATVTGTSNSPSVSPSGGPGRLVAGFGGGQVGQAGATSSTGTIRARVNDPRGVSIMDTITSTASITTPTLDGWTGLGVWLV